MQWGDPHGEELLHNTKGYVMPAGAKKIVLHELHAGATAHCEIQQSDLHPVSYVDDGIVTVSPLPRVPPSTKPDLSTMTQPRKGLQE